MQIPDKEGVLLYGPKLVNVESEPVTEEDYNDLPSIFDYMVKVMKMFEMNGLSAPQIGIFKNFFIASMNDGTIKSFVNPDITRMWGHEFTEKESCVSIPPPDSGCPVPRMQYITVMASSAYRPYVKEEVQFSNLNARVIQHEMDHLTGTFFIERASPSNKRKILFNFNKWKQQEIVAEITGKEQICLKLSRTIHPSSRLI